METSVLSQAIADGVQVIVLVEHSADPLLQKYVFVRDATDRGTGTSICKYGLAGGAINTGESRDGAIERECIEELGLEITPVYHSSFTKLRPGGYTNMNHLYFSYIPTPPSLCTNDTDEVSGLEIFTLQQVIALYEKGLVHEGSIRLLFHYLNCSEEGSLNEPATFEKWTF